MFVFREIQCSQCGTTTRHRPSTLDKIAAHQSTSIVGETPINFACPDCMTVSRSHVLAEVKLFDEVDLSKFPVDLVECVVTLRCEKENCESPVAVFVVVKNDKILHDLSMLKIGNGKLPVCGEGYPVREPISALEIDLA